MKNQAQDSKTVKDWILRHRNQVVVAETETTGPFFRCWNHGKASCPELRPWQVGRRVRIWDFVRGGSRSPSGKGC